MSMTHARLAISAVAARLPSCAAGGRGGHHLLQHRQSGRKNRDRHPSGQPPENLRSSRPTTSFSRKTTSITDATFTGLLPPGPVRLSARSSSRSTAYFRRTRMSGAPAGRHVLDAEVPTRVNSPSDVEFADRDSARSLTSDFTIADSAAFTAANSVQPGGIHPNRAKPRRQWFGHRRGGAVRRELHRPLHPPRRSLFLRASGPGRTAAISSGCRRRDGDPFPPASPTCRAGPAMQFARSRLAARRHGHRRAARPAPTFNAAFSLSGTAFPSLRPGP